ncbi:ABC transporter substrate-binding protein [Brevibacillus dissolubilis]|uniref:ABC transporter substrate-binding protein n=1 Tax=Brevibacillus dissolubilis TaxID=1844116 RepID=UPI001115C2BD|nr:ABC transporter substrate-binding protein [Brevibacillus dissolubilis]
MKKQSWIIAALTAVSMLAGCGQQAQPAGTSADHASHGAGSADAGAIGGQKVTIDFWYSLGGKNGEIVKAMVDEFNQSQQAVEVKATYQGNYYDNHAKVLAALATNTQPDVTMVEIASIAAFADAGALEDLKPFAEGQNGTDMQDYIPGLLGNSYWQDKFVALPFNRSTPLLYVNRDMLKKAGLNPEGPKTWDELREFSKKLSQGKGDAQTWGFSTPIDIWFYEALTFQAGGEILSEDGKQVKFNDDKGTAPIQFWSDMIKEQSMKMPPGEKYDAWDVAEADFTNQKVGMIFTSTGSLNGILEKAKFDVGTAFLPAKESFGVPTGGANLVMLSKSTPEEKAGAWAFMKWLTESDRTAKFSKETGYMPVRTSALESEPMKSLYAEKPQFKVAIDQLQYAKPRPMAPGYKELQETIMSEIQRTILGQATPQDALNKAAEKGQKLLK